MNESITNQGEKADVKRNYIVMKEEKREYGLYMKKVRSWRGP
jgi:hypothetical protein